MGLFQHKKQPAQQSPEDAALDAVEHLFDAEFREELKAHGRAYFERVINENAALFKQDLDATVAHINTELRQLIARQLDAQFAEINRVNGELRAHIEAKLEERLAEYADTMKEAQDKSLEALERSAQSLEAQYRALGAALEKSVAHQDAILTGAVEENRSRVTAMRGAQEAALKTLTESVEALQKQHEQLDAMLKESIAHQEDMLVDAFEKNMARVTEHYLLGALGDQYDIKAQLPSIIKQMEENKQAIVDDMKL